MHDLTQAQRVVTVGPCEGSSGGPTAVCASRARGGAGVKLHSARRASPRNAMGQRTVPGGREAPAVAQLKIRCARLDFTTDLSA
jgi:hypothetical protein